MDFSFLDRFRWIDLAFIAGMGFIAILTFRLIVRAWKKEKEKEKSGK